MKKTLAASAAITVIACSLLSASPALAAGASATGLTSRFSTSVKADRTLLSITGAKVTDGRTLKLYNTTNMAKPKLLNTCTQVRYCSTVLPLNVWQVSLRDGTRVNRYNIRLTKVQFKETTKDGSRYMQVLGNMANTPAKTPLRIYRTDSVKPVKSCNIVSKCSFYLPKSAKKQLFYAAAGAFKSATVAVQPKTTTAILPTAPQPAGSTLPVSTPAAISPGVDTGTGSATSHTTNNTYNFGTVDGATSPNTANGGTTIVVPVVSVPDTSVPTPAPTTSTTAPVINVNVPSTPVSTSAPTASTPTVPDVPVPTTTATVPAVVVPTPTVPDVTPTTPTTTAPAVVVPTPTVTTPEINTPTITTPTSLQLVTDTTSLLSGGVAHLSVANVGSYLASSYLADTTGDLSQKVTLYLFEENNRDATLTALQTAGTQLFTKNGLGATTNINGWLSGATARTYRVYLAYDPTYLNGITAKTGLTSADKLTNIIGISNPVTITVSAPTLPHVGL